jgi:lipoprotein NlpD
MKSLHSRHRGNAVRIAGRLGALGGLAAILILAGCASPVHKAPIEDRAVAGRQAAPPAAVTGTTTDALKPLPGAENAGKPGYYTVRPGDTLIRIGLDNGQSWRDVARWSGLENPNVIEVGQVLRVVPPDAPVGGAATSPVAPAGTVEGRPLSGRGTVAAASAPPAASAVTALASPPSVAPPPTPALREPDDELNWMWPASGPVIANFDEARSKGLAISGKAGDPVLAAADGRVVYAGAGLRGYGNLVIVKHNSTYLSAYAHNQTLLVAENQAVRRGQRIAEMGSSDAERVQLHFEIRRLGKPVDPARLLPQR